MIDLASKLLLDFLLFLQKSPLGFLQLCQAPAFPDCNQNRHQVGNHQPKADYVYDPQHNCRNHRKQDKDRRMQKQHRRHHNCCLDQRKEHTLFLPAKQCHILVIPQMLFPDFGCDPSGKIFHNGHDHPSGQKLQQPFCPLLRQQKDQNIHHYAVFRTKRQTEKSAVAKSSFFYCKKGNLQCPSDKAVQQQIRCQLCVGILHSFHSFLRTLFAHVEFVSGARRHKSRD